MITPNILLVEDSDFMSMRVVEVLEATHGMSLTAVKTAEEARTRIETGDFDVVVVNYELPDETGIELADSLNAGDEPPEIPVILLTGRELEPIAKKASEKGVTEFVYKGDHAAADMDVLANRIKVVVDAYVDTD
ncbi:response regulator [Halonotius terrestris]|uniref:Response regulator n=1 Tax=Halonotius terrestris TaxID=2487750 RepID=A0A8J8TCF6_9EURY|nr:response regulator [Halonotius terrestris]TQQ83260.1 response regulator [Halonotius terrestris]